MIHRHAAGAALSEPIGSTIMKTGQIALYATTGKRQEKHRLVLYIAVDKDWTSRNLERNGNTGYALAMAPMTPEAWQYRNESTRARSLQYSGSGRATAVRLAKALRVSLEELSGMMRNEKQTEKTR